MRAERVLRCGRHVLDLARPRIMGILNVTPNSFSDGGRYFNAPRALEHARRMIDDGADLVDIGGESTRPGAQPVDEAEELARVIPLVTALVAEGVAVSVDTRKPAVMRAALAAGASMINDVCGLTAPGAIEAVAAADAGVCLMHMQGDPRTMQQAPSYADVVAEVRAFLVARAAACEAAGIARDRIVLDPGFGFGKTLAHNLALLAGLPALAATGYPVLAGLSRKASLGEITGRAVDERLAASLAAALAAVARGAMLLRVHDVRETRDALAVWLAAEAAA
ncbi:MAG TPA: dihydropteroate synthase [Casimicrobiaceae bacterium]|jgi:dihydropteroate synthase|nr:dihydropteroate synthase [Casimicrobiaceae bacterium]